MTTTSRRRVLRASIAAAVVSTGGLAAVGIAALQKEATPHDPAPAHLRGPTPLPHAQVVALDLVANDHLSSSLHAAHRVVETIDGGKTSAWLALGEDVFPDDANRPQHLKRMPSFPGDVLDPDQSHGSLLLQITGVSPRAVKRAFDLGELPFTS